MNVLWITAGSVACTAFIFSYAVEWMGFPVIRNSGVAFGMMIPEPFQTVIIVLAFFVVIWFGMHAKKRMELLGFGCVIGGALANILDRFMDGTVVDMFRIGSFPWFNMADMAITVGIIMVIWGQGREMLFTK